MSETQKAYEEQRKLYEELKNTMKEVSKGLRDLEKKILLLSFIQLCRDNERDAGMIRELSRLIYTYIGDLQAGLNEVRENANKELERMDMELEESLRGLLLPTIEFKNEVYSIEKTGLMRFSKIINDMIGLLNNFIESKKGMIIDIYTDIVNHIQDILNEKNKVRETLEKFSIPSLSGAPTLIGIPVIKVKVNGDGKFVYLGQGFDQYELRVISSVEKYKFSVDYQILRGAVELLRQKKSFLYKHFLNKNVKMGEVL